MPRFRLHGIGDADSSSDLWFYQGHAYQLTPAASSWTDAEAEAVAMGGHLVAINDPGEQSFLETQFNHLLPEPSYLWIGLRACLKMPGTV